MRRSAQVLASIAALLVTELGTWAFLRYRPATAALMFCVGALPWLLLLPRLVRGDRRGALWAVLLTSPYIAYGLMEMLANPGARLWAALQVLLAFAVFVASIAHLRLSRPAD
ncbi:MAG: DUF2069 domain-containing protein [Pseudomonadota bacterium]|jgi:hypothetical protein